MATRKSSRNTDSAASKTRKDVTERKAKVEAVRERVAAVKARKKGLDDDAPAEEVAPDEEQPAAEAVAEVPVVAEEPVQDDQPAEVGRMDTAVSVAPTESSSSVGAASVSVLTAPDLGPVNEQLQWLIRGHERLLQAIEELPGRLERLEGNQESSRTLGEKRYAKLEKLSVAQSNLERRLEELQETTNNLHNHVANQTTTPAIDPSLVEAHQRLEEQVETLQKALGESAHEKTQMEKALEEAKEQIQSLRNQQSDSTQKLLEFEELLQTRTEELEELSVLNEELDSKAQELEERCSILAQESGQTILALEDALTAAKAEETMMQLRLLELETTAGSSDDDGNDWAAQYQQLQADFREVQQLHRELREEHLSRTLALQEEKIQLERNLDQALNQLATTSRQYSDQVDTLEKMTAQIELCDFLLEEAEAVIDGIPSPPPSQVQPIRKLRQRITEMRVMKSEIKRPDFRASREQVAALQEELLSTRQRVLEAHTEIDRLESLLKAKK